MRALSLHRRRESAPTPSCSTVLITGASSGIGRATALRLSRPGSVIIADNVVRSGKIIDPRSDDPSVQATRRLHELLGSDPRLEATVVQTVGVKGYDGFALARVRDSR